MNKMDRDIRPDGQAVLEYLDGEFRVVKSGTYVVCEIGRAHV